MFRDQLGRGQHQRTRKIFEARIAKLFDELPMLTGFFVEADLDVVELSVYTWPGWSVSSVLREDIGHFLLNMVEERPEVAELLRGRTFARSIQ